MDLTITPDNIIYWQWGFVKLNATLLFTWLVMAILGGGSWLLTRNLSAERDISRWQNWLEIIILTLRQQIGEVTNNRAVERYLPFIGTLFLFISVANLLNILPGYEAPTGSLSATTALALCVFFAVPLYGIMEKGVAGYLKYYIRPTPLILPFRILSEVSRTIALAVRLFGNVLSGRLIVIILLSIVPLFLPVLLEAFELLIGQIQAYIFAILALIFIASAVQTNGQTEADHQENDKNSDTQKENT